jgi:two-component system response regulator AtoC
MEHAKANSKVIELGDDALETLSREAWPGNVRQLRNFIERLVVLCDGPTISARDVLHELARVEPGPGPSSRPETGGLDAIRKAAEREAIRTALTRAGGNRTVAARILGLSRRGLYYKLDEYGLS